MSISTGGRCLAMRTTALLLVLAAALAAAATAGARTAHPCVKGNEIWFRTTEGVRLVGHRFGGVRPGAKPTVVLAHMSQGDLCQWEPFARMLAANGVFVFAFDFRGHGFSQGRPAYGRLGADVTAAVKVVRGLGARKVSVIGASLGGIAAVVAAANIAPALDGVAAVSAPATIAGRLNALPAAPRVRVPALFVAAEDDQNTPYDFAADARRLYAATASADKKLEVVPGNLHGVFLVAGHPAVRDLLERFSRDPLAAVRT
jgi:alpha-beta hydrolase superfamily lysophospholipase